MYYEAIDLWNSPDSYLEHHGVKGMKWGVRRYQNADGSLTSRGRKKYIKEMKRDMDQHFESQLSPNARAVARIGINGYEQRGQDWGEAYRRGQVSRKDGEMVRKAAAETRVYMQKKYGSSAFKAMQSSGELFRPIDSFEVKKTIDLSKSRGIIKQVEKASRQSQAHLDNAKNLSRSKMGDYDDEELFNTLSKSEKQSAKSRANKAARESYNTANYWKKAAADIDNSKTTREAKEKYKRYRKNSSSYYPFA